MGRKAEVQRKAITADAKAQKIPATLNLPTLYFPVTSGEALALNSLTFLPLL